MFRKLALSVLILGAVVAVIPFAETAARGLGRSIGVQRRHHRKHSRKWWRRHYARIRRAREARAMAAHRPASLTVKAVVAKPVATVVAAPAASAAVPALENGWNTLPAASNGTMKFRSSANPSDQAQLAVVAMSRPNPAYLTLKEQRQSLSGVSFADLRRTVIDKMIAAGGWVSNDYEREVGGRRVFVVTAQTPGDGRSPDKAWNFYFTEVNGRIYSLTTEANLQSAERMSSEAERFIASLR
ncbi:MAG TPA: hypothetical protein VN643_10685 [Pyrinomonadaceae bacterium]|nr:hypothetical protein [Pyrinomonadaceae bacterium]